MRILNKNLKSKKKVTVIGGGIIGLATACSLIQNNFKVTIIDNTGLKNRASSATAGIIGGSSVIPWANDHLWSKIPSMIRDNDSPLNVELPLPSDFISFIYKSWKAGSKSQISQSSRGLASLGLKGWSDWQSLLKPHKKSLQFFSQKGCLLYYSNNSEYLNEIKNNNLRCKHGMKIKNLNTKKLFSKIPKTEDQKPLASLILKAGHFLNPLKFQESLTKELVKKGVKIVSAKANGFATNKNKINAVNTTKGNIESDIMVICAGAGGKFLAKELGSSVSLLPAWGTSVILHKPELKINLPILFEKKGFAIVPNSGDLRIAGLVQVGGKSNKRNIKFENILLNHVKKIFGDFKYQSKSSETGARPLTPDSLPVIGKSPNYENAYFNFGHGHWGMTHAPVCAYLISDLITKRKNKVNIKPYDILRFN